MQPATAFGAETLFCSIMDEGRLPDRQIPAEKKYVVHSCEHCEGRIEFDANELGDRQNVAIPCPHCGKEIIVSD